MNRNKAIVIKYSFAFIALLLLASCSAFIESTSANSISAITTVPFKLTHTK